MKADIWLNSSTAGIHNFDNDHTDYLDDISSRTGKHNISNDLTNYLADNSSTTVTYNFSNDLTDSLCNNIRLWWYEEDTKKFLAHSFWNIFEPFITIYFFGIKKQVGLVLPLSFVNKRFLGDSLRNSYLNGVLS